MTANSDFLCCEQSAAMNEPLAGTAVTTEIWLMLEYTQPWSAHATAENTLPTAVTGWLNEQMTQHNGRRQFIRQFRPNPDTLTCFIGVNQETSPRLYAFQLETYEALLTLDIAALCSANPRYDAHLVTEPHYFICTNGKRDRSCGIYGAALYRAFTAHAPAHVWMTTHLGGHRFAATLLTLPAGVCYGRIAPADIAPLHTASQRQELLPPYMRGRTCYPPIAQIADFHLRQITNQTSLDAFRLLQMEELENGRWQVQFQSATEVYELTLAETAPLDMYVSSGSPTTKAIPQYQLAAWQRHPITP